MFRRRKDMPKKKISKAFNLDELMRTVEEINQNVTDILNRKVQKRSLCVDVLSDEEKENMVNALAGSTSPTSIQDWLMRSGRASTFPKLKSSSEPAVLGSPAKQVKPKLELNPCGSPVKSKRELFFDSPKKSERFSPEKEKKGAFSPYSLMGPGF